MITYSMRYYRRGAPNDVGVLILANESEMAGHKSRLEAAGYVVLTDPAKPLAEQIPG
jgi:hypothetical protein